MADQTGESAKLYALLIGVDFYMPNTIPFYSLTGCVNDVNQVEKAILKDRLRLPPEHILKLTSTNTRAKDQLEPPEPLEQWPTYENIVAAFKRLAEMAQPGDHVYIHYSGHGGRAVPKYPELRAPSEPDETLVPLDIGNANAHYLHDVELAYLLDTMVRKNLIVTVVLDSCHSGGTTRGDGAVTRGNDAIDITMRPKDSLVAPEAELVATWRSLAAGDAQRENSGTDWLPPPKDYVLLAACRPSERAQEDTFPGPGGERHGALTYYLLDTLNKHGLGLTWKQVHDCVAALIHSKYAEQMPQLFGATGRVVFGDDYIESRYSATVTQVDPANRRVTLNAGLANGLTNGAQFAIYAPGADISKPEGRLALVTLDTLGAAESSAQIAEGANQQGIEPGAPAVLVNQGVITISRTARLRIDEEVSDKPAAQTAIEALRSALEQDGHGWVAQAADTAEAATYQVAVTAEGTYEICDSAGLAYRNVRPVIKIDAPNAAATVVQRLIHLCKYHTVQKLDTPDDGSLLEKALHIELCKLPADYTPGQQFTDLEPLVSPGGIATVAAGERVVLRITNDASVDLNVVVLDLQPDWAISQMVPSRKQGEFMPLERGTSKDLVIKLTLPEEYKEGMDVFKVFATIDPTNFRWLELPPLDQPVDRGADKGRSPRGVLEQFLDKLGQSTRAGVMEEAPNADWAVKPVSVRVIASQ